ncbi:MAG: type II toxin-antitoxin system death-on-curing family toxin [Pyrinomonadaceae bacterium]
MPFQFLRKDEVLKLHARLLERFGGTHGLRDEGALESALAAAENRYHYENADLATCAATYAYHLSQAHAFIDGNKRIAAHVSEVFLGLNGAELTATDDQSIELFMKIAAGELSRDEVEQFFKQRVAIR